MSRAYAESVASGDRREDPRKIAAQAGTFLPGILNPENSTTPLSGEHIAAFGILSPRNNSPPVKRGNGRPVHFLMWTNPLTTGEASEGRS